jgi:two-component system sensor histidine kinase KdpD
VLVDEVAHTNMPGSKNNKRYQDILELLDAGINVMCAFNIQHLESLNDLVTRATNVRVRETVPDTFLKDADQVVTLDLDVEDLLDRLQAGKIYAQDKIPWALQHFFQNRNLATLRELALREVAESLGRSTSQPSASQTSANRWGGKLMVCLSSNPPHGRTLLRRGSRLAGRLNTDWYVVYIETPKETPLLIDATAQRNLLSNIELAKELGAEVVRLRGEDPADTLLEFARSHGVSDILIGRGHDSAIRQLVRRSFTSRMVSRSAGFDLHIVSFAESQDGEKDVREELP